MDNLPDFVNSYFVNITVVTTVNIQGGKNSYTLNQVNSGAPIA